MTESFADEMEALTFYLESSGLDVSLDYSNFVISVGFRQRGDEAPRATIEFSEKLYRNYVDDVRADFSQDADSSSSAVGMVRILVVEMLTKDHGGGNNLVRRLTLSRGRDGAVALVADDDRDASAHVITSSHDHEWRAERPLGWRPGS